MHIQSIAEGVDSMQSNIMPDLALRSFDGPWNRTRWEQLPDDGNRYEIIDGVLYTTTASDFFHQWIIRQLFLILYQQIDQAGVGVTVWSPIGVFMPGCDPVQPDLMVVRTVDMGMIQRRGIFGIPALLIEVLSPLRPSLDTRIKWEAYARAGVPEYWIVRPDSRDVLVYSQPDVTLGDYGQSQLVRHDDVLVSPTLPVQAAVAQFFADAPPGALLSDGGNSGWTMDHSQWTMVYRQ